MAGLLYSISQKMHVKQNSGGKFHISPFNIRVMHFQVLRYIMFGENLSPFRDFDGISNHFNVISTTNPRISTI